jgi:hypothetical protein
MLFFQQVQCLEFAVMQYDANKTAKAEHVLCAHIRLNNKDEH